MRKTLGVIAAVSGFITVALGAFGAHGLEGSVSAKYLQVWHTAVQYQGAHTLVLLLISLSPWSGGRFPRIAAVLFLIGMLLFSGSLYLLVATGMRWLALVTPAGGLLLLAGWVALARAMWLRTGTSYDD